MPRSSRSGGGARPSAPRPSSSSSFGQPAGSQRGASTMAAPPPSYQQQHHAAPAAGAAAGVQPRQPGMFAQMASTAAGVAVGSSVGHGISNMIFGGRSSEAAPQEGAPVQSQAWDGQQQQQNSGISCEVQSKDFLRCLEASNNDMQSCSYYLDQLKACQAAARPY